MKQQIVIASLTFLLLLGGCASSSKKTYRDTSKQSPSNFYNAGMLRCSANNPTFHDVCDYAVYYENKVMKIIVENASIHDTISYRILYFSAGRFRTQKKKELVRTQKLASNHYQIRVGQEYYLMPQRAMTYQPMDENTTTPKKEKPTVSTPISKPVVEEKPIEVIEPIVEEPIIKEPVVQAKPQPKQKPIPTGTSRKFRR